MGVTVKGFEQTKRQVKDFGPRLNALIGAEVRASAMIIERNAKRNAPASHGFLKRGISAKKIDDLNYEVISNASYSAYVEWGTKGRARVPADEAVDAAQHRGRGLRGQMNVKDAIYEWCKREGIAENAWWPIFISIMRNGIKPQPFLYPAYKAEVKQLKSRIERIVRKG